MPARTGQGASEMSHEFIPQAPQRVFTQQLPVPLGDSYCAVIPFPMEPQDYTLLLETLTLWQRRLVRPVDAANPPPPARPGART